MGTLLLLVVSGILSGHSAWKIGRSLPLWMRRRNLQLFWNLATVALLAYWAWKRTPLPLSFSMAAVVSLGSFLLTVIGQSVLLTQTGWTHHLPTHLRRISLWALEAHLQQFAYRSAFYQGVTLAVVHLSQPPEWIVWISICFAGVFLVFSVAGILKTGIAAIYRLCFADLNRPFRKGEFDVFVSYRSVNSNKVRSVVDRLIAAGQRPWFAEYMIRFTGRDQFQSLIDEGIDRSPFGILFSNDHYAASEFCKKELLRLRPLAGDTGTLNSNGAKPVLEVRIPDEPLLRQEHGQRLENVPSIDFLNVEQTTSEILGFLKTSGHPVAVAERSSGSGQLEREFSCSEGILRVPLTGWEPLPQLDEKVPPQIRVHSPMFRSWFGRHVVQLRIQIIEEIEFQPQSSHSRFRLEQDMTVSKQLRLMMDRDHIPQVLKERWIQEAARDSMMLACATVGAECHGVRLFWLWNVPHLLLTYFHRNSWVRRYFLRLPGTGLTCTVRFSFIGQFQEYCQWTNRMDDLVSSIKWIPASTHPQKQTSQEDRSNVRDLPLSAPNSNDAIDLANKAFQIVEAAESRDQLILALALLERAVQIQPTLSRAWREYGFVLGRLGRWPEALIATRRTVELEPDNPKFCVGFLAQKLDCLVETRPYKDILRELPTLEANADQLIARFPDYPSAYATKAALIAVSRGECQSDWESYLAKYAESYDLCDRMQSGMEISEDAICSALIQATSRCVELAAFCYREKNSP